jgi:hypothetical protein
VGTIVVTGEDGRTWEVPAESTDEQIVKFVKSQPAPRDATKSMPAAIAHPVKYGLTSDPQRKASVLERFLSGMMLPVNVGAGLVSQANEAIQSSINPPLRIDESKDYEPSMLDRVKTGIQSGISEHKTYGDVLGEMGVTNPWVRGGVGFAADVALDLSTYTGIGALTKAGKVAKGAAVAAEMAGDLAGAAKFGTTMAEQAARGERALLSIGGKTLIKGAPAFKGAAKAAELVPGADKAVMGWRKAFDPLAVKGLTPVQREAHLIRLQEIEGAQNVARRHAVEVLKPRVTAIREAASKLGQNPDDVERLIFGAAEYPLQQVTEATPKSLLEWMTPEEARKYTRWHWSAESAARGANMSNPARMAAADRLAAGAAKAGDAENIALREMGGMPGGLPKGNRRALRSEPTQAQTEFGNQPIYELMTGQKPNINVTKRGNIQTTGHSVNVLDPRYAVWNGVGQMPEELTNLLSPNAVKQLRRFEDKALKLHKADEAARVVAENSKMRKFALNAVPPELRGEVSGLIDDARNILDADLASKQSAGIKVSIESDLPYFPHVASGEMNQAMREAGGGGTLGAGREITEKHAQQLRRAFVNPSTEKQLSRNEANDILRLTGTEATGGAPVEGGFLGLASGTAEAHVRSARAIKSAEVMQEYARNYGRVPVDAAEAAALKKQGWSSVSNELEGVGEKVLFPKPIAESLSMMHQGVFNPKGPLGDALRGFDALTNGWKAITLGLFPSFHTRNELDDLFRATAYGGMDARIIPKAIQVQTAGTALARDAVPSFTLGGKTYTAAELKHLALKHNVTDSGLIGDIAEHMNLAVKKGNVVGQATDFGRKVGTARENSTRMALFMDRLAKGDTPEAAGLFTNKILINYTLKTRFEREIMQRIFPFYMYTSRNLPIQFEYLLKKPGVAAGVQKAREEFAGDKPLGIEDAQLPEFLARGLPVRLGTGEDGASQFGRIEGQLGISDLNTPFNAINKATGLLNPFISTPLEMVSNRDFFTQGKLEDYSGQSRNILGVPMSSRWAAPPVELVRLLSEINRANPGNVFGTKEAGPAWNPELRREYEQPSGLMRALNTLIGRTYPVTDERAQASTNLAREQRINELKSKLRRAATPGEQEKILRELEAVASGAALVPLK